MGAYKYFWVFFAFLLVIVTGFEVDGFTTRTLTEIQDTDPSPTERDAAAAVVAHDDALPRYIFFTNNGKLQEYPSKFCGGTDTAHCDTAHYAESIFLTSAIGFIVAIVALFMGILFWAFRCCCFGGCHASSGVCCPGDRFDGGLGEGYSNKEVWTVKLLLVVVLVCIIPFFVVGHVGNANFTKGVNDFASTVVNAANEVVADLQHINDTLAMLEVPSQINFQQQIQSAVTEALEAAKDITSKGQNIDDKTMYFNQMRERIILAGLILPLCMIGMSVIAALLNIAPLALITAFLGFIVITYGWISFSIHYPLSLIAGDVCVTFDNGGLGTLLSLDPEPGNTTYNINGTSSNVILNALLECGTNNDNANPFKPLLDVAQNGLTFAYGTVCEGFAEVCNTTYPCPTDNTYTQFTTCNLMNCPANIPCNSTTVTAFRQSNITDFSLGCLLTQNPPSAICPWDVSTMGDCRGTTIVCNPIQIPFTDCPEKCRLPEARNVTQLVLTGLNILDVYRDLLVTYVFPLLDCSFVAGILNGAQTALCVTMVNSLTYISTGEAGLSILLIPGLVLSILGIKRFNTKHRQTDVKQAEMNKY